MDHAMMGETKEFQAARAALRDARRQAAARGRDADDRAMPPVNASDLYASDLYAHTAGWLA